MNYVKQEIYQAIQKRNYSDLDKLIKNYPKEILMLKNDELILDLLFSEVPYGHEKERLSCLKFFINKDFSRSEKLFSWICAHGSSEELTFYLSKDTLKNEINELGFQVAVRNGIINGAYSILKTLFKEFDYSIPSYYLATSIERSLMTNYPHEIIDLVLNKIGYIDDYVFKHAIETNEYSLDTTLQQKLISQYEKDKIAKQIKVADTNPKKLKI